MKGKFTYAHPKDVDVAVPGSPGTLRQIMAHYPLAWTAAGNMSYFGGAGNLVGLAAERGTVYPNFGGAQTARWPAFYIKDNKAYIDTADNTRARSSACAFSAGPLLVKDGKVLDIAQEIRAGAFDPWDPSQQKEQRAIGITTDGLVCDGIWQSASLYEVAREMIEAGCHTVLKVDSGGSSGRLWSDGRLEGNTVRLLPAAVVYRSLVERIVNPAQPAEPTNPTTSNQVSPGGNTMKVFIDPGHGGKDPGAVSKDGIREKDIVLFVADRVQEYLKRAGIETLMARTTDIDLDLKPRTDAANRWGANLFVSIHANAADDESAHGLEVFSYPGSIQGAYLSAAIERSYKVSSGLYSRGTKTANFHVLRESSMPAALVELGFLSNKADLALLKEPAYLDKQALGIAFGIFERR